MTLILVTGGNRGIGFSIVQLCATRIPSSTLIIACRSKSSGEESIQKLKDLGLKNDFDTVQLDIEDDQSITAAAKTIDEKYGKLDVLINNAAGFTINRSPDLSAMRTSSNTLFNNCITSNAIVTTAFLPVLRKSSDPRVLMCSSARGSIGRTVARELPAVALVDYCIAKAALDMLTVHFQLAEENNHQENERISFWAVNPGHCKTAFNGYRGIKDPIEGAEAFVRLLEAKRGDIQPGTFWEFEEGEFRTVPW